MMKNVLFSLLSVRIVFRDLKLTYNYEGLCFKRIQENLFENSRIRDVTLKDSPPGGGEDLSKIYLTPLRENLKKRHFLTPNRILSIENTSPTRLDHRDVFRIRF